MLALSLMERSAICEDEPFTSSPSCKLKSIILLYQATPLRMVTLYKAVEDIAYRLAPSLRKLTMLEFPPGTP